MKLLFPNLYDARYWDAHYKYIYELFQAAGFQVSLFGREPRFYIVANNDDEPIGFAIDLWDSPEITILQNHIPHVPIFKFHTTKATRPTSFPFPPISFYDWGRFAQLKSTITYHAEGPVSSRQWPHHAAKGRRIDLQAMLHSHFPTVLTSIIDQLSFWNEISKIRVYVHCPGYSNHILDRAQLQYMAFGCATISPHIPEILPFDRQLVPNVHYIMCKDDFSDVPALIDKYSQKELLEIGSCAKELFNITCTPDIVAAWIVRCLGIHE
jgi:hypothetical protein